MQNRNRVAFLPWVKRAVHLRIELIYITSNIDSVALVIVYHGAQ